MSLYSYSSNPGDMLVDFPFEEMIESIRPYIIPQDDSGKTE